MVQKFSPSALHHGSVHGCFSARANLFIQKAPTNKVKMRLQTKVSYRSTGTQFSQSSLGGRTATKRPTAGRAVNERLGTVSHGNRKDYFRICVLFWPFHLHRSEEHTSELQSRFD